MTIRTRRLEKLSESFKEAKVPFVMIGLTGGRSNIKPMEDFFKKKGWLDQKGKLTFLFDFKTLSGHGGSGGRNDAVFMWDGDSKAMGKFAVQRFGMGSDAPRWHDDYMDNNKDIIPPDAFAKLKRL